MAIAHVQSVLNGATDVSGVGVTVALAYDSNVTAGSLLICWAYFGAGTNPADYTCIDSLTQTFTVANSQVQTTDGHILIIFYKANSAGGANTVTVTNVTGPVGTIRMSISEFSGVATVSPLDQINAAQGSSTTPASGNVTPTENGELLCCGGSGNTGTTYTAGTDFTKVVNVPSAAACRVGGEYYVQPTAAAHNGTWTYGTSNQWTSVLASFKQAAAGSTPFIAAYQPQTNQPIFPMRDVMAY